MIEIRIFIDINQSGDVSVRTESHCNREITIDLIELALHSIKDPDECFVVDKSKEKMN